MIIKMKQLVIGIVFLITTYGFDFSARDVQQRQVVPDSWKKVSACNISFLVPASVENLNARGIDSCVAEFGDSDMKISIDYGMYSSAYKKNELGLDGEIRRFKQEFIRVGGKRAQVVTYLHSSNAGRDNPHLRYVAGMYVAVHTNKSEGIRTERSLNMTVAGRSEKEQEIARRIFRSVRFQK